MKKVFILALLLIEAVVFVGCDQSQGDPYENIDTLMTYLIENDMECSDYVCSMTGGADGGGGRLIIDFQAMMMTYEMFGVGTIGLSQEAYIPIMSFRYNYNTQDLYIYMYSSGTLDYSTALCACNLETEEWSLREGDCFDHSVADYKNSLYVNLLQNYLTEVGLTYEDIIIKE